MSLQERAKRLLSERDYEIAEEAVRLLQTMPGLRTPELQQRMEQAAWLHSVHLEDLEALVTELGFTRDEYMTVALDVRLSQRPEWEAIETHVLDLARALVEHRLIAACIHLARLKWSRVRDFKKARRKFWGEARHGMLILMKHFGRPHGPWLLRQYEEEMAKTTWERKKKKKKKEKKRHLTLV